MSLPEKHIIAMLRAIRRDIAKDRKLTAKLREARQIAEEIQWVSGSAAANALDPIIAVADIEQRATKLVDLLGE